MTGYTKIVVLATALWFVCFAPLRAANPQTAANFGGGPVAQSTALPTALPSALPMAASMHLGGNTSSAAAKASKPKKRRYRIRTKWSRARIIASKARCAQFLRGLDLVAVPLLPIRRNACGAAAPLKLISIGSHPKVALSPAPTVTCELAAAVYRWMTRDVQPMARKHLGAPIAKINVMSSYSCRNAYGRKRGKLSQHAHANALDIRGFETATGVKSVVLSDWRRKKRQRAIAAITPTTRKRLAKHLRQKVSWRQRRREAAIIAAALKADKMFAKAKRSASSSRAVHTSAVPKSSFALHGNTGSGKTNPYSSDRLWKSIFANVNYLGATRKSIPGRAAARPGPIRRARFLRSIHKRACGIFGTVLGPDANYAHRHHFHIDMQKRRLGPFCR